MISQYITKLPSGWAENPLGEVVIVERGSSPRPIKNFITDDEGGVNWIKIGDATKGKMYIDSTKQKITAEGAKKSRYVGIGDFILSNSMSFGLPYIMAIPGYIHDGWFVIRLPEEINSNYFYYLLSSSYLKNQFQLLAAGGVVLNISGDLVKKAILPIAPLPEQKRIVEKLDSLLAQVDTIQQRLNNLPNIIKRFRQSVLAAAVSGKLTEQWRGEKRITSWEKVILQDAANIIDPQPSHRTPPVFEGGVPYIGIGDLMADGSINFERARKVSLDVLKEHNERYQLKEGDFLFGKIGTLGKATKLPMNIDYTLSANVILIQPLLDVVLPEYLTIFLSAPTTMNEVAKQSNSTSQAAFGIKKMRAFKCELPVIKEQTEIVRLVDQYFALADTLEKNLANAKQRVDNLTQSILAKAFKGELVPQDPNDEPAEKLLARIKAARAEAEKLEKAAKNVAKTSKAKKK